jgi:aryl-alcohol dehydrogenase-like predicted oxidoreductase
VSIRDLVLGTAGYGLEGYPPLSNALGKPDDDALDAMLRLAWESGVVWLDTAESYGDAEARLGRWGVGRFHVVSKLAPNLWPDSECAADDVCASVSEHLAASLARLGVTRLDGYLLHSARYAHRGDILDPFLRCCQDAGIPLAGVSCYEPGEALAALRAGCSAVQVPHNLFDLRAWDAGVWVEAVRRGAQVFARSPFCQGLLALPKGDARVPERVRARHANFRDEAARTCDPTAFALSFALSAGAPVVFACDDLGQLRSDLATAVAPEPSAVLGAHRFGGATDAVVNPSLWAPAPAAGAPPARAASGARA